MSSVRGRAGIEGKWEALTEERNGLRERVAALDAENGELAGRLAGLQQDKMLGLTQLRDVLRQAVDAAATEAPPLWIEKLEAAVLIERDRAARVSEREKALRLELDDEEQEAWDALSAYMTIVFHRWKLRANHGELTAAIHVLQGTVQQHMLHRLAPGEWGSWWEKSTEGENG